MYAFKRQKVRRVFEPLSVHPVLFSVRTTLMKPIFLIICFFLLTHVCGAQDLRIVKDNIKCAYGIKDQAGKWVIQADYIVIEQLSSGHFLMTDENGDGIVSPTGRWMIECSYDQLSLAQATNAQIGFDQGTAGLFFYARKGNRTFLLNSRGKQLVELFAKDRLEFDGFAHMLIYGGTPLTSTYLDTNGNILIDKFSGVILPFGNNDFSLYGKGIEAYSKVVTGNVRLINRKGEFPLDQQFDRAIFGANNQICFENEGKYGEMTTNGTLLIEPKYSRKEHLSSSPHIRHNWIIFNETGQFGLMKPNGTLLLQPIYDNIEFSKPNKPEDRLLIVTLDQFTGVFNSEGKEILPVVYDAVTVVYDHSIDPEGRLHFIVAKDGKYSYLCPSISSIPKTWYDEMQFIGDSYHGSLNNKLIVRQGEKFGLLNADGTTFFECKYEGRSPCTYSYERYFFWNDLEVVEYDFRVAESEPKKWEIVFKNELDIWFTHSREYVSGRLSESTGKLIQLNTIQNEIDVVGNLLVLKKVERGDWQLVHVTSKEQIVLKKVAKISSLRPKQFLITSASYKVGVMDEDGNLLIEPKYIELKQNPRSTHLWALIEHNYPSPQKWILIDEFGAQVYSDTVSTTFEVNKGDQLMTQDGKTGLFDTKALVWKIPPTYPCLVKSADDYYIAGHAKNKKGILRADGKVILPFNYSSINILTNNDWSEGKKRSLDELKIKWIARSGNKEIIVDQDGNQLTFEADTRAFKLSLLYETGTEDDPINLVELRSEPKENPAVRSKIVEPEDLSDSYFFGQRFYSNETRINHYPKITYASNQAYGSPFLTQTEAVQTQVDSIPASFKNIIFDTINALWERETAYCMRVYGLEEVTVKHENELLRELQIDCNCMHQHFGYGYGHQSDRVYYQVQSQNAQYVAIQYGIRERFNEYYMTMSQLPPPPPAPNHLNFVYRDGRAQALQLSDIFTSDSVLFQEFITALQKRDDLELDCSSTENMLQIIHESGFSLSEEGVHVFYKLNGLWDNTSIEFLIPIENLNNHAGSKWIVPILRTFD